MNYAKAAWSAFRNMLHAAARNPLWAFLCIILGPFRAFRPLAQTALLLAIVVFVVGIGGQALLREIGYGVGSVPVMAWWLVTMLIVLTVAFVLLSAPMILHFGDEAGATHGSARFATNKEMAPLARAESGLLIGRDAKSKQLMRYDGPAHLLTMAPTRTGKGVGTIIPNLLTADRSVICIDPKGENGVGTRAVQNPALRSNGAGTAHWAHLE